MTTVETFIVAVKRALAQHSFTNAELARMMQQTRSAVWYILHGTRNLRASTMDRVARALGMRVVITLEPETMPGSDYAERVRQAVDQHIARHRDIKPDDRQLRLIPDEEDGV